MGIKFTISIFALIAATKPTVPEIRKGKDL
jgi:hypothetical protein